jgi:VCBS repeat-containing protein
VTSRIVAEHTILDGRAERPFWDMSQIRFQPGEATHNLSLYRDASGALVFGAGMAFWNRALGDLQDTPPYDAQIKNRDLQKLTIAAFAELGIFTAGASIGDAILASKGLIRARGSNDPATATLGDLPDQVAALRAMPTTGAATDDGGNAATADGDAVSYDVAGGADVSGFVIKPTSGPPSLVPAPGFEAPAELGRTPGDTIREAIVSAPDDVSAAVGKTFLVTVADTGEADSGASLLVGAVATEFQSFRATEDAPDAELRSFTLATFEDVSLASVNIASAPGTPGSRVVAENAILDGVAPKSYWDVPHSTHIEGFATDFSVNAGSRIDFKINVNAATFGGDGSDYKIEIFRLGYYGGFGAREVAEWVNTDATVQPNPLIDRTRGLVDAGNWSVTDSWQVPEGAVSGVYLARLQRLDANGNPIEGAVNQIPFVVRNDGVAADIVLQTSDTTWQAYNAWGGNNGQLGANFYGDAGNVADARFDLADPGPFGQDRAYAVSYNRPFITRGLEGQPDGPSAGPQDYLFGADYAAIYWLEKNGYDVTYISGIDTDRMGTRWFEDANGVRIRDAFISVGHDEYWSGQQRGAVEAARSDGVHLLFWSGNEVYWKTRWDTSIVDGVEYRTLVCYKETWANGDPNAGPADYANLDPSDVWTGTWRDSRFSSNPLAGANDGLVTDPLSGLLPYCNCAENHLTGQSFGPDGTGEFGAALDVPAPFAVLRVWRDTSVANGGQLDIAPGILGYEWNTSPEDQFRPDGLIKLSDTTAPWSGILVDQGNRTEPGEATHNLSLYRDESGALVFGAGTVFWSWGLSDLHDSTPYGANIANRDLQQFTVNMFADMGIFPADDPVIDAILASQGLVRAIASNDLVTARATINDLPDQVTALQPVVITGTATDDDGNAATADGRVAVVEVSLDGGLSWRAARTTDGWETWSYTWRPTTPGEYTVLARAIDDSLNLRSLTPDQEVVTVVAPVLPAAFSLFGSAAPVSAALENDNTPVELGMKFAVDRAGAITELQYWRAEGDAGDTDIREGRLWGPDGQLLGTATFTSAPNASGWQTATLLAPVAILPNVQYVVSYRTNDNYVATNGFFSAVNEVAFDGRDDNAFSDFFSVIRAPQDALGAGNGVFRYGSDTGTMPTQTFRSSNYWVDVTFDPAETEGNTAPTITSADAFGVVENSIIVGTVVAVDPDGNALRYAIAGGADAAKFAINASTGSLTFTVAPDFEAPTDLGGTAGDNVYVVVVSASDNLAAPTLQTILVSVTDAAEAVGGTSLFAGAAPAGASSDANDYELGLAFTANQSGFVTQLQYFRTLADAGDIDTRTLTLWSADGTSLASVSVTSAQGAVGWQAGTLAVPVALTAGGNYIVSYGYNFDGVADAYAFTANTFVAPITSAGGALTARSSGQPSGLSTGGIGNGLFNETLGLIPQLSFNASNYWVDVTFQPIVTVNAPPTVVPIAVATNEDAAPLEVNLLAGAQDLDPLAVTLQGVTSSDGRNVQYSLSPSGSTAIIPTAQFNDLKIGQSATVTIAYTVSDGVNPAVANVATIQVAGRNDAPVAVADSIATTEAAAASGNVLIGPGADSDPDGDALTVVAVNSGSIAGPIILASGARVTMSAAGDFVYDPNGAFDALMTGQTATDSFTYSVSDGFAQTTAVATVTIAGIGVPGLTLVGTNAANVLNGGAGDDRLSGLGGNDQLFGNAGKDTLDGGTGSDLTDGGEGNDIFIVRAAEAQADTIIGGAGIDAILVDAAGGALTLNRTSLISGIEVFDAAGQAVRGTSGGDVLDFSIFATVSNLPSIEGLGGNDRITGTRGTELINGGTGNDTLTGGEGSDTLDGGTGSDLTDGGEGNDIFIVRAAEAQADTIIGGAGIDAILVDAAGGALTLNRTSLISGIEVFDAAGQAIRGTTGGNLLDFSIFATVSNLPSIEGLGGNDRITGTRGAELINGGSGSDTLFGGGGDDTMIGGTETDTFLFRAGITTGAVRILDFDAAGNDVIRFEGYSFGVADPSTLSSQARRNAVRDATVFDGGDAMIDLGALGDSGTIRLVGVTSLTFNTAEDFVFG